MLYLDKELVLELESMRSKHGVCGKDPSPSRLDAFVRSLEEERDYYRQEAERYRRARGPGVMDHTPTRSSPGRGRSPRGRTGWHGRVREPAIILMQRIHSYVLIYCVYIHKRTV